MSGLGYVMGGGNGQSPGNETEDEDHEFFDAMSEGISNLVDDKTSFVMKVPVNRKTPKQAESSDDSESETVTETQQVVFVAEKQEVKKVEEPTESVVAPVVFVPDKQEVKKVEEPTESVVAPVTSVAAPTASCVCLPTAGKKKEEVEKVKEVEKVEKPTESLVAPVVFVEDKEEVDKAEEPAESIVPPVNTSTMAGPETETKEVPLSKPTEVVKVWPHVSQVVGTIQGRPRRTRVPDKPNYPLSLWSIMKNCIGKELSKIPIPVNFSEPLSMLQRLAEDFEYSCVLDEAAKFTDPAQQLAYVAAFTVSAYSTTSNRTNKPFNPLLGETYECDRSTDLGWRSVSEQVSHHPPMVAQFCEGQAGWQCWQEFTMTTKFRGKYLQVIPLGGAYAHFLRSGNKYAWRKVTTTVHNIIVGKLWVDNHGDMDIVGESGPAAGYVAHLKYLPYGYFSKDTQRKVTGVIKDPSGVPRYVLQGHWDSKVEVAPVTAASADNTQCKTGKFCVAWERVPAPQDSDKWYNYTLLAAQLNEPESGVAITDSRLRPDQRLMEEGLWDEANDEKLRLEEKQRAKRRALEAAAEEAAARGEPPPPPPKPLWFTRETGPSSGTPHLRHLYNHKYWECKQKQDWSACPDIF